MLDGWVQAGVTEDLQACKEAQLLQRKQLESCQKASQVLSEALEASQGQLAGCKHRAAVADLQACQAIIKQAKGLDCLQQTPEVRAPRPQSCRELRSRTVACDMYPLASAFL